MYVSINRLRLPAEYAEHLEQAFGRSSSLAEVPGFRAFRLLKNEAGGEYLVYTEWEDKPAFERWLASDAFSRAHAGSNPNSPVKSELSGYEVVIVR